MHKEIWQPLLGIATGMVVMLLTVYLIMEGVLR
jgi:hypothetical protein